MEPKNFRQSVVSIIKGGAEIKRAASIIAAHSEDPVVKLAMEQISDIIINQRGDFKNVIEYGRQQLDR